MQVLEEMFGLKDKTIWVIGGAGYLGQSVVRVLSKAGAHLICADLGNKAHEFVKTSDLEAHVIPVSLDISNYDILNQFIEEQIHHYGCPDGLVNMTYASTTKRLEGLTAMDFDQANQTGITASFLLARGVASAMANHYGGSLVLFASMYGIVTPEPSIYKAPLIPNPIEYGVGKAGIIQMAKYLAMHYGRQNVRCNSLSPGPFPNPTVQQEQKEFVARLSEKTFLGRIGKPEEIAGTVCFLLSNAANYITGHNLVVDGGWTSW